MEWPDQRKAAEVGDKVKAIRYNYSGHCDTIARGHVTRATKTRIVTTFGSFMISTGVRVGDSGDWRPVRIDLDADATKGGA